MKSSKSSSPQSTTEAQKSPLDQKLTDLTLKQSSKTISTRNTNARKFKASQRLTIPLISVAHTPLLMVEILGEMYEADMDLGSSAEKAGKPTLCRVFNLDTESDGLLICNEIIRSSFLKVEPTYVRRVFQIKAGDIRPDKRYRDIDVTLMEEES